MRWACVVLLLTSIAAINAATSFYAADLIQPGQSIKWSSTGSDQQIKRFFFDVVPQNGAAQYPHEVNVTLKSQSSKTTFAAAVQRGSWTAAVTCPDYPGGGFMASPYQCTATNGAVSGSTVLSIGWPVLDRYYVTVETNAPDTFTAALVVSYCQPGMIGHNCTYPLYQLDLTKTQQVNVTAAPNQFYVYQFSVPFAGSAPPYLDIAIGPGLNCNDNDNSSLWFRWGSVGYHSQSRGLLEVDVALNCSLFQNTQIMYPQTGLWFLTVAGGNNGIQGTIEIDVAPCPAGSSTGMKVCQSELPVPLCQDLDPLECDLFNLVPVNVSGQNFSGIEFNDADYPDRLGFAQNFYYVNVLENVYDLKAVVTAQPGSQNFTIIARQGNIPTQFPAAQPLVPLEDLYEYYASPNSTGVAELRVRYAPAGTIWYFGVWSDPQNPVPNASFNITVEWFDCYMSCNNRGKCNKLTSQCTCKSGWKGDACDTQVKSHAGLAVGLIFGLFLPLGVIIGGALFYHFYWKNRQGYELIGRE